MLRDYSVAAFNFLSLLFLFLFSLTSEGNTCCFSSGRNWSSKKQRGKHTSAKKENEREKTNQRKKECTLTSRNAATVLMSSTRRGLSSPQGLVGDQAYEVSASLMAGSEAYI